MKMLKKISFLALIVLINISLIYAIPMVPTVFSGTAQYSGDSSMSLNGYDINVSMSGKPEWNVGSVGGNNKFEVDVDPDGANPNGTIYFYVGGVPAAETGKYIKGGFVLLDLTISSPPTQIISAPPQYCGDGSCNNGESCSSCSQDCGSCDTGHSSSSGSSGGGGGGGSSSYSSDNTIILNNNDGITTPITTSTQTTPITGGVTQDENGFLEFIGSGGLIFILAGLIILLGILLILMPKR